MNWRVLAASGVLLAGPSAAARAAEPAWIEVRSANFQVLSDASERDARGVALRFEQIRAAFASFAPGLRLDPGRPVIVIAARDEKSMARLLPSYFERGVARPGGLFLSGENRVFVVMREDVDDDSDSRHSVLFHEYVHLLQSANFRTLPLWLAEGLAEFYAHTTIQEKRVLVGRAAPWHIALLGDRRLMPLNEFFAVDHTSPYYNEAERASLFYAQAWAITHWLIMGDKGANHPRLRRFMTRLDEGAAPSEAIAEILGSRRPSPGAGDLRVEAGLLHAARAAGGRGFQRVLDPDGPARRGRRLARHPSSSSGPQERSARSRGGGGQARSRRGAAPTKPRRCSWPSTRACRKRGPPRRRR